MPKTDKKSPKVTPLGDRILIKAMDQKETEQKSASGIILPGSMKNEDKLDRGTVIAVGEGRIDSKGELISPKVKEGNKVLFQWGDKITIEGEEYFIVNESSILAILK